MYIRIFDIFDSVVRLHKILRHYLDFSLCVLVIHTKDR